MLSISLDSPQRVAKAAFLELVSGLFLIDRI